MSAIRTESDGRGSGRRDERFLTRREAARWLNTSERFVRRLTDERRIAFCHFGRHVRIPESALREFIESGFVEPVQGNRRGRDGRAA